jgi:hypothetical protein
MTFFYYKSAWSIKILYYSKTIIWVFFWLVFPWPKNQFLAQDPTVQSNPAAMVPTGSNGTCAVLFFFFSGFNDAEPSQFYSALDILQKLFNNGFFLILQGIEKITPM